MLLSRVIALNRIALGITNFCAQLIGRIFFEGRLRTLWNTIQRLLWTRLLPKSEEILAVMREIRNDSKSSRILMRRNRGVGDLEIT